MKYLIHRDNLVSERGLVTVLKEIAKTTNELHTRQNAQAALKAFTEHLTAEPTRDALNQQSFDVSQTMIKYGGSFAQKVGEALQRADDDNVQRIYDAFPEMWSVYLGMAEAIRKGDQP